LPPRTDYRCGERVAFEDGYLQTQVGTITRINQRTATVDTGDGTTWRVEFARMRQMVDA
jgi:FKBP-type peptidyl-prolyl cis-trans isomerase 2